MIQPHIIEGSVRDQKSDLAFSIPCRRDEGHLASIFILLIPWPIIFVVLLLNNPIWLLGWIPFGLYHVYVSLWAFFGIEIISISSKNVRSRIELFGYGHERSFERKHIQNIRVNLEPINYANPWSFQRAKNGTPYWCLEFEYGKQTIDIAFGVEKAKGYDILKEIESGFPKYQNY